MARKKIKLSSIKPNPKNPRYITAEKFEKLVNSIITFPKMMEIRPMVIQNAILLGGNMRRKAIEEIAVRIEANNLTDQQKEAVLEHAELFELITNGYIPGNWVTDAKDLTEAQIKEFIAKDNIGFGEWDFQVLLEDYDADELEAWGLDFGEEEEEEVEVLESHEDEFEHKEPQQVDVVEGDVIQIGKHFIVCGDSTSFDCVQKLLKNKQVDLIVTDPPYGVSATGGRTETVIENNITKIQNDDLRDDGLKDFISDCLSIIPLKPNKSFYVFYDSKTQVEFIQAIKQNDLTFKKSLIWNKNVFGLNGHKGYRPKFEMIAFGHSGTDYEWHGDNSQADVIDIPRPTERPGNHPTPKPIALLEVLIKNSSKKNDIVFDSFLGSGSTMVACHQLNRVCYGVELEPKYCQSIIERMLKLDPSLDVKINGETYKTETPF